MAKYRKKPVEIEAVTVEEANQILHAINNDLVCEAPIWLIKALAPAENEQPSVVPVSNNGFMIATTEGLMRASPGDYIIKWVKGEIYPCKPDIFQMTYDKV